MMEFVNWDDDINPLYIWENKNMATKPPTRYLPYMDPSWDMISLKSHEFRRGTPGTPTGSEGFLSSREGIAQPAASMGIRGESEDIWPFTSDIWV